MPANELRFEIIVDDRGTAVIQKFEQAATDSYKKVSDSGKVRSKETIDSWEKAFKNMTGGWERWKTAVLGALSKLGAKILGWAKKVATGFMEVAVQTETLQLRLQSILGSTKEANKLFNDLSKFAGKVPFTFGEIAESGTMLAGVLKGGRKEIMQYMPMIADLAAATGVGIQETTGQFMRMVSAGIGACDLWREKGVKAMLGFKDGVQYSQEESVKMFVKAWEDINSQFRGATDKLKKSWSGMLSMFSGAWREFRQAVMEADVFKALKSSASDLLEEMGKLKKEGKLDEWARDVAEGAMKALEFLIKGIGFVGKSILSLQAAWRLVKDAFIDYFTLVSDVLSEFFKKLGSMYEWLAKWALMPQMKVAADKCKEWSGSLEQLKKDFELMGTESEAAVDKSSASIEKWESGIKTLIEKITGLKTGTEEATEALGDENTGLGGAATNAQGAFAGLAKEMKLATRAEIKEKLETLYGLLEYMGEQAGTTGEYTSSAFQKIRQEADTLFKKLYEGGIIGLEEYRKHMEMMGKTIPKDWRETCESLNEDVELFVDDAITEFEFLPPEFEKIATSWDKMVLNMATNIANAFGNILCHAESFGGAMKSLFGVIQESIFGDFMGGMAEAFKGGYAEKKEMGGGFLSSLKGGFGGIGKFLGGDWIGGIISAVTTFMPMLVGLFHKPEWKKVGEEVARDLGVGISEELSKKIAETSKEIGDRYAAISVHIADVMREVGLTTENFETFGKRAHDILSHFQTGVIDSATATESLDDAFSELVKGAEDMGITFSRSMIDIIRHSRELGLEVKSISEFIDKKLNASIGALNKMIKGMANSQDEFNRVARVTLAIFNEIIASGGSYLEAINQIKECLDELAGKQEEWGLEGTEAYDKLKKFANLVEANKDLVESVQGMTDAYSALGSIGALTSELFADWQEQALAKYDQLIAAGFSENEALRMLAPTLNALAEAAKTYTYNISDSMQGLYDAADAQNLLKETNPFERMNDSLDRMVTILEKLAKHWGVIIDDLETYRGDLEDLPTLPGYEGKGGRGEEMQFGTPYVPHTGYYKLHEGEAVIPASQNRQQSMQMGGAGGQVLNLQVVVPVTILDEELTPRLFRRIYDGSKKGEVKIHAIAVEKG